MENEDRYEFKGFSSEEIKKAIKVLRRRNRFSAIRGLFNGYIESNTDRKYRTERIRCMERELLLRGEIKKMS